MPCPSHPYRHASPTDGCRCEHCVIAFSDAPQEGRPTTPQTEAGPAYVRARQFYNERNLPQPYYDLLDEAVREAAAGALPSVDVRTMAEAYANVMGHLHPPMIRDWEQIAREYARLAAAPPEASER
jgi:hypothetical protein